MDNRREAARSAATIAVATAAWALLHSALASRSSKRTAARLAGPHTGHGLYRAAYNATAFGTLGALAALSRRLPDAEIYNTRGPLRLLLRAGQVACGVQFGRAILDSGVPRISGLRNLYRLLRDRPVPPVTEGQSVPLDEKGELQPHGAYLECRHPLNFWPAVLLCLCPRLTAKRLAFNITSALYFYLGSFHEEAQSRAAHGEAYDRYIASGVPFFLPRLRRTRPKPPP